MNLIEFKKKHNIDAESEELTSVILDMNKSLNKEITIMLNMYRKEYDLSLSSVKRELLREKVYYEYIHSESNDDFYEIYKNVQLEHDISYYVHEALKYIDNRMQSDERAKKNILGTIHSRLNKLNKGNDQLDVNTKKYLQYIKNHEKDKHQLVIFNLPKDIENINVITNEINRIYDKLLNYHYLAIVFNGKGIKKQWEMIAKTAVYAENFKKEHQFNPFNKERQINVLQNFLRSNEYYTFADKSELKRITNEFYEGVSYGFIFTDLYISDDNSKKVLMLQKIKYDPNNVPCPDCLDNNPRGNSYTKVLQKSFECSNPNCVSRSKSGRGKRYNYLSAKLQVKRRNVTPLDKVPEQIYREFRRDIFKNGTDLLSTIVRLYSFEGDSLYYLDYNNSKITGEYNGRDIVYVPGKIIKEQLGPNYSEIPIVRFINKLKSHTVVSERNKELSSEQILIENVDSTKYLRKLKEGSYKYAVTSPPYYNAREYSQWDNMLTYLIDMLANAISVFGGMENDGVYLYNIGDIVDQDNIYVSSMMSRRRQILGLYSVVIFEAAGFNLTGNIIWDKGEVQSRRNSTADLLPYYVKTINAYEHVFVFKKGQCKSEFDVDEQVEISPVIKIDRNKRNTLGHTAPFPEEVVGLIDDFIISHEEDIRILDPFLGSGTTALWCRNNNYKCLGLEISKDYYLLSKERLGLSNQLSLL